MYDPARDIFTSSDDPPSDGLVPGEGSDGVPANGQEGEGDAAPAGAERSAEAEVSTAAKPVSHSL